MLQIKYICEKMAPLCHLLTAWDSWVLQGLPTVKVLYGLSALDGTIMCNREGNQQQPQNNLRSTGSRVQCRALSR